MRTVYLGTSQYAADVLVALAASNHRPVLVVTRPDRPSGRGLRVHEPPVALAARELGIELAQPESVNEPPARAQIADARPDVVCVCAFGALIREPLLSEHEILNVHPSLLPRWRGAAPIERAIMAGDERTGVAVMALTAGLDSGPVCLTESEAIDARDDFGTLAPRLAALGSDLLVRALDERPPFVEQPDDGVTYAEKIGPGDRLLDGATRTAYELERVVRALHPHIGARALLADGTLIGVAQAALAADAADAADPVAPVAPVAPGRLAADTGRLLLGCTEGVLELVTVQPPGKKPMRAADYLRGHALPRPV